MNMRRILLASISAFAFPACVQDISGGGLGAQGSDTGSGDTGSDTGTGATASMSAAVDRSTVSTELGKMVKLTYTFTSQNGFTGSLALTPPTITGWTITANPSTVTLAASGTATAELDVMVPTDATELAPSVALGVNDGTNSTSVASAFTVANQLTIVLDAAGSAMGLHTSWPGQNAPTRIRSGTKIVFHNSDVVAHRIHSGGSITHEPSDLAPGADYIATDIQTTTSWYCHDHEGAAGVNRPVVVE